MADEGRVALYFLEPGEFPLPGKVTYDREYTPFRSILPEEFDWSSSRAGDDQTQVCCDRGILTTSPTQLGPGIVLAKRIR